MALLSGGGRFAAKRLVVEALSMTIMWCLEADGHGLSAVAT